MEYLEAVSINHRCDIGRVEGGNRWRQDIATMSMNRIRTLVEQKIVPKEEGQKFWFDAYCM